MGIICLKLFKNGLITSKNSVKDIDVKVFFPEIDVYNL